MSIENHKQICDKLHEIYKKKNKDYGNSFLYCYEKFGLSSPLTRILDKTFRLENLILNGKAEVAGEAIEDTLVDLANYAIMTAMLIIDAKEAVTMDDTSKEHELIIQRSERAKFIRMAKREKMK